jgi:hypothetical protein
MNDATYNACSGISEDTLDDYIKEAKNRVREDSSYSDLSTSESEMDSEDDLDSRCSFSDSPGS